MVAQFALSDEMVRLQRYPCEQVKAQFLISEDDVDFDYDKTLSSDESNRSSQENLRDGEFRHSFTSVLLYAILKFHFFFYIQSINIV